MDFIGDYGASLVHNFCPLCWWDDSRQRDRLQNALEAGDVRTVDFLIRRRNVSPHALLPNYDLPIIRAAKNVNPELVKLLLSHGALVDTHVKRGVQGSLTPLIAACLQKNKDENKIFEVVNLLLKAGANPALTYVSLASGEDENKYENFAPRTAADFAEINGYNQVVALLNKCDKKK